MLGFFFKLFIVGMDLLVFMFLLLTITSENWSDSDSLTIVPTDIVFMQATSYRDKAKEGLETFEDLGSVLGCIFTLGVSTPGVWT